MSSTDSSTKFTLEDMLRKVQALLTRADHPNTPQAEADASRAKAEALMYRYRIDEAMFSQAQPAGMELKPEWATWDVCNARSEFKNHYMLIAQDVCNHVGIRQVFKQADKAVVDPDTGNATEHARMSVCEAVGYESDLRIAQALYASCMLAFQLKLEPKYDPALSNEENAYIMRHAGMEAWRIAEAIFGRTDKSLRPKVRKMFKEFAEKKGEDPTPLLGQGNLMTSYRADFASGFVWELRSRLSQMRLARMEEDKGAVVLASRNEAINETFYAAYPMYRPVEAPIGSTTGYVSPNKGCAKCAKAKSGYCREHGYLRPIRGKAGRQTNYEALARGGRAAKDVDLGSTGGHRVGGSGPAGEL